MSAPQLTRDHSVLLLKDGTLREHVFTACVETSLTVVVNGAPFVRLACSGEHPEDLVTGFLFSCRVVESPADILSLRLEGDGEDRVAAVETASRADRPTMTLTSALGWNVPLPARAVPRLPRPERPEWRAETIMEAVAELDRRSEVFHRTGGCHNAMLLDRSGVVFFAMDIGRHNAIDTLVGHALRHDLDRSRHMVISSGRIASEIVQKILCAGFPVFGSISRAMSRAIDLAREAGLTLLGDIRPHGFHIYHDEGRLILPR